MARLLVPIIVVLCFLLSGCESMTREQTLSAGADIASVMDGLTTARLTHLDKSCYHEIGVDRVFVSAHPSDGQVLGLTLVGIGLRHWLANWAHRKGYYNLEQAIDVTTIVAETSVSLSNQVLIKNCEGPSN